MFGSVQYEVNNDISYLDMQIRVGRESTTIDLSSYVRSLVKMWGLWLSCHLEPGCPLK
jgi:hypothetical protein